MTNAICFQFHGRFGHFRRGEAATSALSYPVPPRTALLGLIGAILGLAKDEPQVKLEPFRVAVAGRVPMIHWHKVKLRKDPPDIPGFSVNNTQSAERTTKPEKAALIPQEWLINPFYTVWVSLPEPYHHDFAYRVRERRWYFQPSLGLSEMQAELTFLEEGNISPMPPGCHLIDSIVPQDRAEVDVMRVLDQELALNLVRMPRTVTPERVFSHAPYLVERDGRAVPVVTEVAFKVNNRVIMFL